MEISKWGNSKTSWETSLNVKCGLFPCWNRAILSFQTWVHCLRMAVSLNMQRTKWAALQDHPTAMWTQPQEMKMKANPNGTVSTKYQSWVLVVSPKYLIQFCFTDNRVLAPSKFVALIMSVFLFAGCFGRSIWPGLLATSLTANLTFISFYLYYTWRWDWGPNVKFSNVS